MKRLPVVIASAILLTLNGSVPAPMQSARIHRELDGLVQRGYAYRMLPDNMVELTSPFTGTKQLRSVGEPREHEIRAWAAARGIPIMDIDPSTVDTTSFSHWYRLWTRVPASTPANDFPVIADVDRNSLIENYGATVDTIFPYTAYMRIYEVDTNGIPVLRYTYPPPPFPAIATDITDIDNNGLSEFCIANAQLHTMKFFEQLSLTQLPTNLKFVYTSTINENGDPTTTPYFGSLDGDTSTDCLHLITEPDSDSAGTTYIKIIVAEFDSTIHNLRRVWSSRIPPRVNLGSFADATTVGDFDNDGKTEFATTTAVVRPTFFIFENDGDNSFHLTFEDSISNVTNYNNASSGDIDGDGKLEIFTTATIETGNWVFVHEADSNDHFSIKLVIHVLAGGTFDSPLYFAKDMDGDGKVELVFTAGEFLIILKGNGDNQYRLWFLKKLLGQENILLSDFNHDGLIDLAVGKYERIPPSTQSSRFTDIYLRDRTVNVSENKMLWVSSHAVSNVPNPFNPGTTIKYSLPSRVHMKLSLYDVAGRLVRILVDDEREQGNHSIVLDASAMASGIYFCRLQSSYGTITTKLLLIH